jgi:phosphohistidine phosphatase
MKQLLLIRHAKSSWEDENIDDLERPLSDRGKREAKSLGKLLAKNGIKPQLIISSPARRAKKTANKIVKQLNYPEIKIKINSLIYSGSLSSLLTLVNSLDKEIDQVFIIGHDPSIMELGNYLSNANIKKLSTSGFMLINFSEISWKDITKGRGRLVSIE